MIPLVRPQTAVVRISSRPDPQGSPRSGSPLGLFLVTTPGSCSEELHTGVDLSDLIYLLPSPPFLFSLFPSFPLVPPSLRTPFRLRLFLSSLIEPC